jgi:hypothetical protein
MSEFTPLRTCPREPIPEIVEDLEAALSQFATIAADLKR